MSFSEKIKKVSQIIGVYMTPVSKSSNIQAYGYKGTDLYILFKNDILYIYPDTDPKKYMALSMAASKGNWVYQNLVKTNKAYHKSAISL